MMTKRTTALLVAMVIPASAALAAQRQSIRMDVDQAVTLAGKAIPAGSYKLSWQGDGDAVKVRVAQGRKVVAEADGQRRGGREQGRRRQSRLAAGRKRRRPEQGAPARIHEGPGAGGLRSVGRCGTRPARQGGGAAALPCSLTRVGAAQKGQRPARSSHRPLLHDRSD